jgi:hypothetical protein
MIGAAETLRKIRRWADLHRGGVLSNEEMASAFLSTVMEAPLTATDDCLAVLPPAVCPLTLQLLAEFARREYYDDRHAYTMDGRTLEQRQEHYRCMQSHYRVVGDHLLARLRGDDNA